MNFLDPAENKRYQRQIMLPQIGQEGQMRLKSSSALIVGLGGLGSPVALYLAAAGLGRLGLVDSDTVEASNLQRQILYGSDDVGHSKVELSAQKLAELNLHVQTDLYAERLTKENADSIVKEYDVVIDCSDNFATRYAVNAACVRAGKPVVMAALDGLEGQIMVLNQLNQGPCYACLYPPTESSALTDVNGCDSGGVLGVLPGVIGTLQATAAIRICLGWPGPDELLLFDAGTLGFRSIQIQADPDCATCKNRPALQAGQGGLQRMNSYHSRGGVREESTMDDQGETQPREAREEFAHGDADEISVEELQRWREQDPDAFVLLDVREPYEAEISKIEGARLIPISEFVQRFAELDPNQRYVVHCKVGIRSAQVVAYLKSRGFRDVRNLVGGINEWADKIDRSLPVY